MSRKTKKLYRQLRVLRRSTRQAKRITIVLSVVNLLILTRLMVGGMP